MKRWPSITRGGCSFLICRSSFQPSFTFVGLSGTVCLSMGWFFWKSLYSWRSCESSSQVFGPAPDCGRFGGWNLRHFDGTWPWPQHGVAVGGGGDGAHWDSGPGRSGQWPVSDEGDPPRCCLISCCLQIKTGHESVLRQCFQPILDDIERMYKTYEMNKVDEVFIEEDDGTYVSSNVMRNQLRGLSELTWEAKESRAALRYVNHWNV